MLQLGDQSTSAWQVKKQEEKSPATTAGFGQLQKEPEPEKPKEELPYHRHILHFGMFSGVHRMDKNSKEPMPDTLRIPIPMAPTASFVGGHVKPTYTKIPVLVFRLDTIDNDGDGRYYFERIE